MNKQLFLSQSSFMSALRHPDLAQLPAPSLHVWQGMELARMEERVLATGYPALDAELPGGGWPIGLVEVMQDRPQQHVWQLTGPALAEALRSKAGPLVLVSAPFEPFFSSLQERGISAERMLRVRAGKDTERLWATEQALRCSEVAAVLAWLPQARSEQLRRLQIAAQQHDHLLFVFRTLRCLQDASPARLRLQLSGTQAMEVRILKRRGPPLQTSLLLPAHPERLEALLEARKRRVPGVLKSIAGTTAAVAPTGRRSHGLDRIAAPG